MEKRELSVPGAWELRPRLFDDERGTFLEWFRHEDLAEIRDTSFVVRQANVSVSAVGVLRGVHVTDVPPGQGKYVTCVSGAVQDVVVDLRPGSPTFGAWDGVLLDDTDRRCVYVPEGVGHAFLSLADGSVVTYLCTSTYDPARDREVHPLDPAIGIAWAARDRDGNLLPPPRLSPKDAAAPTLAEALERGLLSRRDG